MLHTKYKSSRPSIFREEEFCTSPFVPIFPIVTFGTGPVLTRGGGGNLMNKLGRGPLGDAYREEEF